MHLLSLSAKHSDFINTETGNRPPIQFTGSFVEVFCNDWSAGKVIRLRINSDGHLFHSVVGNGIEMDYL